MTVVTVRHEFRGVLDGSLAGPTPM